MGDINFYEVNVLFHFYAKLKKEYPYILQTLQLKTTNEKYLPFVIRGHIVEAVNQKKEITTTHGKSGTIGNLLLQPHSRYILFLIIVTGLFLRVNQLGKDSFWFDETGVASVASAKSIGDFVEIVRSHVMAMPLDYVPTWLIGHVSNSEAFLRFPSVIWGVLSLLALYKLSELLSDKKTALVSVLLLSLSPLHIKYSQELRFYSSLVFFYIFCTYLIIKAIEEKSIKKWLMYILATSVGIFFHVYVFLTIITGAIIIFMMVRLGGKKELETFRYFIFTTIILLVIIYIAYLSFWGWGLVNYEHSLNDFSSSYRWIIGSGLGWFPTSNGKSPLIWIWGGLCFLFEIFGAATIFRKNQTRISAITISIFLQIAIIVVGDIIKGYFLAARQFLIFLPFLFTLGAIGLMTFTKIVSERIRIKNFQVRNGSPDSPPQKVWLPFFAIIILFFVSLSSIPAINHYYIENKGSVREITNYLGGRWRNGDSIIITPDDYWAETYKYYFSVQLKREDINLHLWSADINHLAFLESWTGQIYLVANAHDEKESYLSSLDFYQDENFDAIWIRN